MREPGHLNHVPDDVPLEKVQGVFDDRSQVAQQLVHDLDLLFLREINDPSPVSGPVLQVDNGLHQLQALLLGEHHLPRERHVHGVDPPPEQLDALLHGDRLRCHAEAHDLAVNPRYVIVLELEVARCSGHRVANHDLARLRGPELPVMEGIEEAEDRGGARGVPLIIEPELDGVELPIAVMSLFLRVVVRDDVVSNSGLKKLVKVRADVTGQHVAGVVLVEKSLDHLLVWREQDLDAKELESEVA